LVKFAELHRKNGAPYPLTPVMTQLWIDILGDLDPKVLDAACLKVAEQGCRREFPIPADIRAQIDSAQQINNEKDWEYVLDYIREWVHQDIHFSCAPELPPDVAHAAKAAGGLQFLRACSHEELGWRKKIFIEELTRLRKTGDLAGFLTGGELNKLLKQAVQPGKQVPQLESDEPQQAVEETAPLK